MHTPLPRGTMNINQEIASQPSFVRRGNQRVRAWSEDTTATAAAAIAIGGGSGAEALPVGPTCQDFFSLCVFLVRKRGGGGR
jgi:hypothetical protein